MSEEEVAMFESVVHGLRAQGWSKINAENEALDRIYERRALAARPQNEGDV